MGPEAPPDWAVEPLSAVAEVLISNVDKKSASDEIPVRLCNYMDVYNNRQITADLELMRATATPLQVEKFGLRMGDVVITKDSEDPADIAVPAVVAEPLDGVVCGYHLAILRPQKVDGPFLSWALRWRPVNDQFVRRANGTTRFGLTREVIRSAKVPVPPYLEQRKIAAVLSSVDAAIAATKKVIDQTNRVKQGLLQTLMIRGIGHNRFKKTEIGEIPEEWSVLRLGQLVEPVYHEQPLEDSTLYRPVVIRRRHGGVECPVTKRGKSILVKKQFRAAPGAFAISKRQIIHGACGVVPEDFPQNAIVSKEYLQLRSRSELQIPFLDLYARTPAFYRIIERCTYGVDREKFVLSERWLFQEKIPVPPPAEQSAIIQAFQLVDRHAELQQAQLERSHNLKVGLMNDLLTGRVRVQPD
jgi:type I restriction enzyme S subunit